MLTVTSAGLAQIMKNLRYKLHEIIKLDHARRALLVLELCSIDMENGELHNACFYRRIWRFTLPSNAL